MTATTAGYLPPVRRPAALGRRIGAYLIDCAIAVLVLLIAASIFGGVSFATGGALPLLVATLASYAVSAGWFVVYTLMQGANGSLGMRALGLRLAHVSDDARLGFGRALGRNLVWGLGSFIVVGVFSPLFDGSEWRRGWHDKASGAVMTDVAGRGAAVAPPVVHVPPRVPVGQAPAGDAASPAVAPVTSVAPVVQVGPAAPIMPQAPSVPAVPAAPAAPILPTAPAPELDRPAPARSARSSQQSSAMISFVPGVSDPETFDAPAVAVPGIPVVDAPRAEPVLSQVQPAPLDDPLDHTRASSGERPIARLVWDDGTRQALYARTVFGRNPAPEPGAMLSPMRDETLSLSKTHFELDGDAERGLWVTDRHSTNGVTLRRGTQRLPITPGDPARVRVGDVLEFGDRHVTIEAAV